MAPAPQRVVCITASSKIFTISGLEDPTNMKKYNIKIGRKKSLYDIVINIENQTEYTE